jgi:hypothetical protein
MSDELWPFSGALRFHYAGFHWDRRLACKGLAKICWLVAMTLVVEQALRATRAGETPAVQWSGCTVFLELATKGNLSRTIVPTEYSYVFMTTLYGWSGATRQPWALCRNRLAVPISSGRSPERYSPCDVCARVNLDWVVAARARSVFLKHLSIKSLKLGPQASRLPRAPKAREAERCRRAWNLDSLAPSSRRQARRLRSQ